MGVELIESIVSPKVIKDYCGYPKAPLHPNRISAIGGISTVVGTMMLSYPYTAPVGVASIIFGDAVADHYDGKFARKFKLKTKEGAKLDPFFDKVKNLSVGSYVIAVEGISNPLSLAFMGSFVVDGISQRMGRGPILEQILEVSRAVRSPENCEIDEEEKSGLRASIYGKIKTGLQAGVHITYALNYLFPYESFFSLENVDMIEKGANYGLAGLLTVATGFGLLGIVKRVANRS
ncbi:MAG: CDP-alcohol phosphatidyltransferase family protein [Nanoarchaeota archaeon]|nr:CDP-alcohol phosphatidyltransferase family protein [Nanoarchaeota archaeon]